MFGDNFGINLSSDEKAFFNDYCGFIMKFGFSNNFPLSDEEKMIQYNRFCQIIDKLTPEEVKQFNAFNDRIQMQELRGSVQHR